MRLSVFSLLLLGLAAMALAESPATDKPLQRFPAPVPEASHAANIWKIDALLSTPKTYPVENADLVESEGIRPVFYEGMPFEGTPTRVFAWVGVPSNAAGPVPGIVLVHGGGGTAYRDWVKLWMDRGYAAIAMDTNGSIPLAMAGMDVKSVRHAYAPTTGIYFKNMDKPVESQWVYHAVASVILAHSLLRSLPGVDPERIGITGISWGGILSEIAVSIDSRFKFAAPVYGCGFLGEDSFWLETDFQQLPPAQVERWIALWDPSQYLSGVTIPMLFCNGANDKHFRPDSWQKTYQLPQGPVFLSLKVGMGHSHPPVGDPKEITRFADSIVKGGKPLATISGQGLDNRMAWIKYSSAVPIQSATLVYTKDGGNWVKRQWLQIPATIDGERASAILPEGVSAYYFNIQDNLGCTVSSQHQNQPNPNP